MEVARKELPYSFDVTSNKGPTSHHTQEANITPSSNIRFNAEPPGPAAAGPHPEGIGGWGPVRILTDRERAGQRTNGHVSLTNEPKQQGPGDLQLSPFSISARRPSAMQGLVAVEHKHGGEERERLQGGQGSVWPPFAPFASGFGAQDKHYDTSSIFRQIYPPLFAPALSPSTGSSPQKATSTEGGIQGELADRISALEERIKRLRDAFEAEGRERDAALSEYIHGQYLAMQKEIANRLTVFVAERQNAEAAVNAEVAKHEAQIHILRQQNDQDASFLDPITSTTSWGQDNWNEGEASRGM